MIKVVDPTGLAPVSLGTNTRMLLYTPWALGPPLDTIIQKELYC